MTRTLLLLAGILACVLVVACVEPVRDDPAKLKAEIAELHAALELFTRNEGSCAVRNGGPRVICAMVGGAVQRRDMEPGEYIAFRSQRRK